MHYKNGREAHNGDKVAFISGNTIKVGILYNAVAGNNTCNGSLATIGLYDPMPNLAECLHMDDAAALLNAKPEIANDEG